MQRDDETIDLQKLLAALSDDDAEPDNDPENIPPPSFNKKEESAMSVTADAPWTLADLDLICRDHLGISVPNAALRKLEDHPVLGGLVMAIHMGGPDNLQAVYDWAVNLAPDRRDSFLKGWEATVDKLYAALGTTRPKRPPQPPANGNGAEPQAVEPKAEPASAETQPEPSVESVEKPEPFKPIATTWEPPSDLEYTLEDDKIETEEAWDPSQPGTAKHPKLDPEDGKQQVEINTERHKAVDRTLELLPTKDPSLFVAGDCLVCVYQRAENKIQITSHSVLRHTRGTHALGALEPATLSYHLARALDFYAFKTDKKGESKAKPVHPPGWLASIVLGHAPRAKFRQLRGITEAPILRPDGSICLKPGYDHQTGYYYAPFGAPPDLLAQPTRAEATDAINRLLKVVYQFPFQTDNDKVVWISYLLSIIARPAIGAPIPGLAMIGNRAGCGKGKLIDLAGVIATGRQVPTCTYPQSDEEAVKLRVSFILSGISLVHLDNVEAGTCYGGGPFDSALTSIHANDRILGTNRTVAGIEALIVWALSGNQIAPGTDASRRWLPCHLESHREDPENRPDLVHKVILAYALQHRSELLGDALTILRAHALAGRPRNPAWGRLGSYEVWDDMVRSAIWWSTGLDCCATRQQAATASPDTLNKIALLEAWRALPGGGADGPGVTVEDALAGAEMNYTTSPPRPEKYPELRAALLRFSPNGKLQSTSALGVLLRTLKAVKINGLEFQIFSTTSNVAKWHVVGTPTQE